MMEQPFWMESLERPIRSTNKSSMNFMNYKHIDLSFLIQFTSGDPRRMERYIQMFLTAAPAGLATMKQHYAAGEWEPLRSAAHSIKPQIAYMGISSLKETIQQIENDAREQTNLDRLAEGLLNVERVCTEAFEELAQALNDLKTKP
ncbi:MAG: hypothetical protein GC205_10940 [Bacteroidetes bacterium]|nr:hypothetical protein [Bacteroidota bacterium]